MGDPLSQMSGLSTRQVISFGTDDEFENGCSVYRGQHGHWLPLISVPRCARWSYFCPTESPLICPLLEREMSTSLARDSPAFSWQVASATSRSKIIRGDLASDFSKRFVELSSREPLLSWKYELLESLRRPWRGDQLVRSQHCCQVYPPPSEAVLHSFSLSLSLLYIRVYASVCVDTHDHVRTRSVYINGRDISLLCIYIFFLFPLDKYVLLSCTEKRFYDRQVCG